MNALNGAPSLGAIVLVNSYSADYDDFQHLIQPYLDNFGIPYSVLDIATTDVGANVQEAALIIIGHRQIDVGNTCLGSPCLSAAEQSTLTAAVNAGAGLVNFDNDLTGDGSTPRYPFIQDLFNFSYTSAPSGSGVLFTPEAESHYITARHPAGDTIPTGNMTLAGMILPGDGLALATTGGNPFLAVRDSGSGRGVQWGSYAWMSVSVKGPLYGLDDLVWRSMAWAARKPFIMQGMPPFLTLRVDDESGPFDWIHVANEVGIKPWAGLFLRNIDENEAADLSGLVNAGQATATVHAFDGAWFYWDQTDEQMAANYLTATTWFNFHNIPLSRYVLPHYYQFGTNAFGGLADWNVECVGTQMDPGTPYGAPWILNGPYRKYEAGSSNGRLPQYYADYVTVPGHPEFDGRFFNLVTEIRDDLGYEWSPNNDVISTIAHGTLQTRRALDSMALATLFTHDQRVSAISMDNWRAILQGITANLASYNPIYVTMDYACQYIRSKYNSKITGSSYDSVSRQIAVSYSGATEIPTRFYLFMEDQGAIHDLWVDVPQFNGQTQVLFTLPGELDHIVVSPQDPSLVAGASLQFTALGYDSDNHPIPNLPFTWSVVNGGGAINHNGLFTASSTPGTYVNTVVASFGTITGMASVTVVAPTLDHFTFQPISSPQIVNAPFQIRLTARDSAGNPLPAYSGHPALSASQGAVTPDLTGDFNGATWVGMVSLDEVGANISLTARDGSAEGTSSAFEVQLPPSYYQVTSTGYDQMTDMPFEVTVTAFRTTIDLWEDMHQDPVLATTGDVNVLNANSNLGRWTEFLYSGRDFPSIMASSQYTTDLPTLHFFASGIPNGRYQVIANLYDNAQMRYYFGYSPATPEESYVDTLGGATGTQHREYSLGTLDITENSFNLYVNNAQWLGGYPYYIFGWAWIQLAPLSGGANSLTLSATSETMVFDGDGDDAFGEPGDNVKPLADGGLTIPAVDSTAGQATITATDFLGQTGSKSYTVYAPTGATLSSFTGTALRNAVRLEWQTANEMNLEGFNVYRSETEDGLREILNASPLPALKSGQLTGESYQFTTAASPGKPGYYWLELVVPWGVQWAGPVSLTTDFYTLLPLVTH